MSEKKTKLAYANTKDLVIAAIIEGLYSFKNKKDAQEVLQGVREKFVLSKLSPADEKDSLILWIKDFEVLKSEKNYSGNFASVFVEKKDGKKWTLKAQKVPTEIKHHPQRIYEKSQHPNWGHPSLRLVKKGLKNKAVEPLQKILERLQEDFPKTSVPAAGKLYLMIYEKALDKPKGGAVNKYVLEIKATEANDGFYVDYYLNTSAPKKATSANAAPTEKKEAQGKFTTMVELRRAKKKPKATIVPKKPND